MSTIATADDGNRAVRALIDAINASFFSSFPSNAAGWLSNNGLGALAWSTPTYANVGADPAGAAAAITLSGLGIGSWAGSTNVTTLGTIGAGLWQGTAIADTYIASAATWSAKYGSGASPSFTNVTVGGVLATTCNLQTVPTGSGFALGWNLSGGYAEVNFWNTDLGANISFQLHQRTGVGTYTTLASFYPDGSLVTLAAVRAGSGFSCNGATPQAAYASGGALAAYAGGTYGLDSSAHMSALVTLVSNIRSALVANGTMS